MFVAGSKAPCTAVRGVSGSVTSRPPSQVIAPAVEPELQPGGLLAILGIEV